MFAVFQNYGLWPTTDRRRRITMNSTDSLSRGSYLRSLYDETCGLVCFGWMLEIIRRLSRGEVPSE